ncbi:MAG: hypothetical protein ACK2T3_00940, partial [Candidatus Promineifilaceae bacterium]
MKRMRVLSLSMAAILGFSLALLLFLGLAGKPAYSQDEEESQKEIEKALKFERETMPEAAPNPTSRGVVQDYPLFMGVDDVDVPAYRVDPVTNLWSEAFIGAEVWGSAFDRENNRLLFNFGSTLYSWQIESGTIITLGKILNPDASPLVMVGLAHYDGVLYGVRNLANEAVWAIDTSTLSATVFIDYDDGSFDFGGFAADPNTGEFYGTNDTAPTGLYRINPDGTGAFIASYPAGETDIDGLAISDDGIAYLVTDEPGTSYAFDLNAMTYTASITNPWIDSYIYSAAAWIPPSGEIACNSPAIDFSGGLPSSWITHTTGPVIWSTTDDSVLCGSSYDAGSEPPGACADAHQTNPGSESYDAELWSNSFSLEAAASAALELRWRHEQLNNSAFYIDITTNGGVTWSTVFSSTANNPSGAGGDADAIDLSDFIGAPEVQARFRHTGDSQDNYVQIDDVGLACQVPGIDLRKTVGTDLGVCAGADSIRVLAGTEVEYCYQVTNSGSLTLTLHDLVDSELGTLLDAHSQVLAPGDVYEYLQSSTVQETTINTATWTAYNPIPGETAAATATAAVEIIPTPLIDVQPNALSSQQTPNAIVSIPITISNLGNGVLNWELMEEERAETSTAAVSQSAPEDNSHYPLSSKAYTWSALDNPSPYYSVFDIDNPEVIPNTAPFDPSGALIGAGEYYNGYVYMIDNFNNMWRVDP